MFDPDEPWNAILQQSHPDACHAADRFWQTEVKDKCTAYLTQVRSWNQVMDDGTSQSYGSGYQHTPQGGKRQRLRNRGKTPTWPAEHRPYRIWQTDAPKTSQDSEKFMSKDKQGTEVCRNFNEGKCETPCPRARSHVCKLCGQPGHTCTACTKNKGKSKDTKGKKGKGKGKKGKAGKY